MILIGSIGEEIEQTGSAIKFGKEEGGMPLGFRATDPLKAGLDDTIITATFAEHTTPIATQLHYEHLWMQ
jgi:hypothetical protein